MPMSIYSLSRANALTFSLSTTLSTGVVLFPFPSIRKRSSSNSSISRVNMGYEQDLAIATKAVSLAARLCQTVQKSLLQTDTQSKMDNSPVTVADYGSQALVSFVLERELPLGSFSMVAEEDSQDLRKIDAHDMAERITELVNQTISLDGTYNISPLTIEDVLAAIDKGKSEGGPHGRHWVLDPIDGTKGFLRGDQYAIALGLLDEGKVTLGVLGCPNLPCTSVQSSNDKLGCIFSATKGAGTTMQSLDGSIQPKRVYVSAVENPEEASFFESYEAAHSMHDLSAAIAKKLGVKAAPVRIDSQAKYGAMARGDGAIYLRFPRLGYREKIWDHAAGFIVLKDLKEELQLKIFLIFKKKKHHKLLQRLHHLIDIRSRLWECYIIAFGCMNLILLEVKQSWEGRTVMSPCREIFKFEDFKTFKSMGSKIELKKLS